MTSRLKNPHYASDNAIVISGSAQMIRRLIVTGLIVTLVFFTVNQVQGNEKSLEYDVVVYGGTSAGVMAAVEIRLSGRTVAIVCPDNHLGGMSSGGLGWTDTGNKAVIGGLAREFYHRIWKHYQQPEAWKWQKREEYGNRGQGTPAVDGERRTMWIFEPHVAEGVFEEFIREYDIPTFRDEWLDRVNGVVKENGRIRSIRMLSGKTFIGKIFIDATYEGDLMAAAGCQYRVGRESQAEYGENGPVCKRVFSTTDTILAS